MRSRCPESKVKLARLTLPFPNLALPAPKSQGSLSTGSLPVGRPSRVVARQGEGGCAEALRAFLCGWPASEGGDREKGLDSPAPAPLPEALRVQKFNDVAGSFKCLLSL